MRAHRRLNIVLYNKPGHCRVCRQPVTGGKRQWHNGRDGEPNCLHEYKLANWPQYLRSVVFERDGGVCVDCPPGKPPCDTDQNPVPWHADHVVPLIDGGSFGLENVATRCKPHHDEKTVRENRERAAARRLDRVAETGQLGMELPA